MDRGLKPACPSCISALFFLAVFSLAWNGCLDAVTAPPGLNPERMARDSGDVAPTGAFRRAAQPLPMSAIRPSQDVAYWERRLESWAGDSGALFVLDASVDTCANRTEPCSGPLADIRSSRGEEHFNLLAPSTRNYTYYVGWTGAKAVLWNDRFAIRSFLGRIDNETEALYWAANLGYSLDSAYIRKTEAGFELLMDRLDSMCSPYRLLRLRVIMGTDGHARETGRRTTEESFDKCIMI